MTTKYYQQNKERLQKEGCKRSNLSDEKKINGKKD